MPEITLAVKPGSALHIGTGPVTFSSPNAPLVKKNDIFLIKANGQKPGLGEIGYLLPGDTAQWPHYFGPVAADGSLMIFGMASADGDISQGLILASGVLPPATDQTNPGFPINIFGYYPTIFIPAGAAAPVTLPSMATLIAAVQASWDSHVPVADWIADADTNVTYTYAPGYLPPALVRVPWSVCLTDAASAKVAALLGGTVKKEPPPAFAAPSVAEGTPVPLVNYIYATVNGVASKALAQDVVQAFNGRQVGIGITIPGAFKPV